MSMAEACPVSWLYLYNDDYMLFLVLLYLSLNFAFFYYISMLNSTAIIQ